MTQDLAARRAVESALALARMASSHPVAGASAPAAVPETLAGARALAEESFIASADALASAEPGSWDALARLLARAERVDERVRRTAVRVDARRRQALDRGLERLHSCGSTRELVDASALVALDACLARQTVLGRIRDDVWSPWRSAGADDEALTVVRRTHVLGDLPRERRVVERARAESAALDEAPGEAASVLVLAPVVAEGGVRGLLEVRIAAELVDTPTVGVVERFAGALGRAFEVLAVRDRRRAQAGAVERLRSALADPGAVTSEGPDELPTAEVDAVSAASHGAGRHAAPGPLATLTPRQRETLELMARGLSNAEIADVLVIGVPTVKSHVTAILRATGALNRAEVIGRYLDGTPGGADDAPV